MTEESGPNSACFVARRALLLGAGAAGLTALLGACGADCAGGNGGGITPSRAANRDPGQTQNGTPTSEGSLVALSDVPVGGGVIAPGDVLVVRPTAGTVKAFDARCPHQFTLVGTPNASGVITCPGHMARFRATDGSRIDGPSPADLRAIEVTVRDGNVVRV